MERATACSREGITNESHLSPSQAFDSRVTKCWASRSRSSRLRSRCLKTAVRDLRSLVSSPTLAEWNCCPLRLFCDCCLFFVFLNSFSTCSTSLLMTISLFLAANDIHGMIFQVVCRISEQTSPMGDETVRGDLQDLKGCWLSLSLGRLRYTGCWVINTVHSGR